MERATWTDQRLDELSRHIAVRFDRVDDRFTEVDRRFERLELEVREVRTEPKRDLVSCRVDLKTDIAELRGLVKRRWSGSSSAWSA